MCRILALDDPSHQIVAYAACVFASLHRRAGFAAPLAPPGCTRRVERKLELDVRHLAPGLSEMHGRLTLLAVRPFIGRKRPPDYYGLG